MSRVRSAIATIGDYAPTSTTFSVTNASIVSPIFTSLKFWIPMPHAYIHFLAICEFGGFSFRPDVEADDDGVRGRGQQHIGFGNCADARMQDANLHLVGAQLVQHLRQRFLRALYVALQDERHFLDF